MSTKEKTDLAVTAAAGLPAALAQRMAQDAGKGVSTDAADNLIPLVYIIQAQSPQANKRSPDFIEGGEAGAIWLRNSGLPAVSGEEGILFQPCYFSKDIVEWIPRNMGGGFVGRHEIRAGETEEQALERIGAVQTPDPQNPNRSKWLLPNGHEAISTRYHIGNVYLPSGGVMPYVIPMSSSGHTVSKAWMVLMNSKRMEGVSGPIAWSCLYRLKTKERTNAAGTWSTWDIQDAGWISSVEDYDRGAKLYESFAAGEKQVEAPEAETHADAETAAM